VPVRASSAFHVSRAMLCGPFVVSSCYRCWLWLLTPCLHAGVLRCATTYTFLGAYMHMPYGHLGAQLYNTLHAMPDLRLELVSRTGVKGWSFLQLLASHQCYACPHAHARRTLYILPQVVRELAVSRNNTELENASLFALVNVAMADAGILCWQQKYKSYYARPVTGLRAAGRPGWEPLGAPKSNEPGKPSFTPPFPAYPSGHATFGAAALHIARLFYGIAPGDRSNDTLFSGLTFVSDELNGQTLGFDGNPRPLAPRQFPGGLWQMIMENGFSRIYLG
jgi:hypothetical protein